MSYLNYLQFFSRAQRDAEKLPPYVLINSIMVKDIKDEPELADDQFYLTNDPLIIPTIIILYYQFINRRREGEIINFAEPITNRNDKNIIIDLIKNYISTHISNLASEVGEIRDPTNEEIVEVPGVEQGIELPIRPINAIPEKPPIDVDLLPVDARILSNEEITNPNLPTAKPIKLNNGGKTKKRKNKYKKATNKKHKKHKRYKKLIHTYRKLKNNKK